MNIVVDELLTFYEQTGTGKIVLLLHGWGDSVKGFASLQRELGKKYRVVALDLPGFGASEPPKTAWDLDDYAAFLHSFINKLHLEEPYAVVGHSNGGALAIRGIALGALSPQKLVLLAASGIRDGRSVQRVLLTLVAKTGKVSTLWLPGRYRRALRKRLYGAAGSDLLTVPHMEETFKKTVRQDVQKDAARLQLPTLLIYADRDQAVPFKDAHIYQKLIKNSELDIITGAGHFLHLEQPNKVNKLIMGFLQ